MALVLILIGVGIMLVNQKVLDSRKSYTTITGKFRGITVSIFFNFQHFH
jgi:iron(III) transport system permease protein